MFHLLKPIVLFLLNWVLIGEFPSVAAGRIPSKNANLKEREINGGIIDVDGLDVLKTYVCSTSGSSNTIRRRKNTSRGATMTVAVPVEEAAQLWQELYWIIDQLGTILEAEGLLPVSAIAPAPLSTAPGLIPTSTRLTPSPSLAPEVSIPLVANPIVTTSSPTSSRPSSTFSFVTITTGKVAIAAIDRPELPTESISSPSLFVTAPSLTYLSTSAEDLPRTTPTALSTLGETNVSSDKSTTTNSPAVGSGPTVVGILTTAQTTALGRPDLASSNCSVVATQTIQETKTLTAGTTDSVAASSTAKNTSAVADNISASVAAFSTASILSVTNGGKLVTGTAGSVHSVATGASSYVFDAQSTRNIAVYFGQSPVTSGTTLGAQCADPNIDIVILAFLISASDQGKYPGVNFGAACGGQTPTMMAQAPGLLSCTELEGFIEQCQSIYGKKVLLSIGGAASSITFSSASDASNFADILWRLFGPPGNIDPGLRPFGNVSIDGFDFDNENNQPSNYDIVASALRSRFQTDPSKSYYLSSAPQCPFPDASNPLNMLLICDFVFVQFYNNGPCEIGSTNFHDSIHQWSTALAASTANPKPRLYIGAPAWSAAGPTAYAHIGSAKGMQGVAADVKGLGVANLGGVMFWDGPEAILNLEGGKDILEWTKEGMGE